MTTAYSLPESHRGHSVIVTGAARGIGKGVALALLERGAAVMLVDDATFITAQTIHVDGGTGTFGSTRS